MEEEMKRVVLAHVLSVLLLGPVWGEDPVYFADPALQEAVESELWVSDPTPTDLLGLLSLSAVKEGITDLTGLEYAANLQTLNLAVNEIHSVTPLAGLINLQRLVLNNNAISDLSALSGLANLQHLDIHDNQIASLSALSSLGCLEDLILHNNRISSLSGVSALSKLWRLDVLGNQISDISPLTALHSLTILDLRQNPLNQDAYNVHIPQIRANNPGIEIRNDPRVPRRLLVFSTAGGTVIAPGEGSFAYEDGETVRLHAQADPGFVFIRWSGSLSSTSNPVDVTLSTDHHMQAHFARMLDAFYVAVAAAHDPGPNDPNLSDPQEDGTLEHPFDSVQEAIDAADDGMSILVGPGTYYENINLLGKRIQLLGIDSNDPNHAAWPVLDGDGTGPVVTFAGGENADCLLTGFVITGGRGAPAAAIACSAGSPTIANCLIAGNRAIEPNTAAVYCSDSNAVFVNCTIAENDAGKLGAGVYLMGSSVTFANSILWGNTATEILADHTSQPFVSYSNVAGGWPGPGNMDTDPLFALGGYWTHAKDPNQAAGPDEPGAVWIAGDYHLRSQTGRYDPKTQTWMQDDATSACIDAGDPAAPVGDEPSPNGAILNMGAYGGTTEASKSVMAADNKSNSS